MTSRKSKSWFDIQAAGSDTLTIRVYGVIGDYGLSAMNFEEALNQYPQANSLKLRIHSDGGSVLEGYAIFNILKRRFGANIETVVDGLAASMASYLFMLGSRRIMPANTWLMIHGPRGGGYGQPDDLRNQADLIEQIGKEMLATYSKNSALTDDEIAAMLTGTDTWINAQTALEYGFATEIEAEEVQVAAQLDLSKLKNVPKEVQKLSAVADANQNGKQENSDMPIKTEATVDPVEKQIDVNAVKAEALNENQARVDAINAVFSGFKGHSELAIKCIMDQKCTVEMAQAKLLAELGKGQGPVGGQPVTVEATGRQAFIDDAVEAIIARAGKGQIKAGNGLRGYNARELARMCAERAGIDTRGMDPHTFISAAFTGRDPRNMITASITQSRSDFPVLLENTMHKVLQAAYAITPDTWRRICAVGSVSDFRAHNRYRLGSIGNLDSLMENGEFKNKTIPDGQKASITAATKGNVINLTRQAIIDDDLGAFIALAEMLGRATARTIEADFYATLALNSGLGPTMGDGNPLFHGRTNANNITTGAALTAAAIDLDRVAMASMKDISGNDYLSITPATLLVPMSLGSTARTINSAEYDPDVVANKSQMKPNTVRGLFRDVIDSPRLSGTRRYLFADPSVAPAIEVAFLNGVQEPFLDSQEGFNVDGVKWKVRIDYGIAGIDERGAVTNAGQ